MKTDKKIVEVYVNTESIHFKNDPRNYTVCPVGYDPGDPIGHGATKEEAIEHFIEDWFHQRNELIETKERL